jgi:hypothetical protein
MFKNIGRNVPRKPRLMRGAKEHNVNEITLPGSPALWAGSFNHSNYKIGLSYAWDRTLFLSFHNLVCLKRGYANILKKMAPSEQKGDIRAERA